MKKVVIALFFLTTIYSCGNTDKTPDVSNIKINLQVKRFEQDFFSLDTLNLETSLQRLHEKYPGFMQPFVFQILSGQGDVGIAKQDVKAFIRTYKALYDSSQQVFRNIGPEVAAIKRGL